MLKAENSLAEILPCQKRLSVLLVWPRFYSQFPPLGLLKLASYHRSRGDIVVLVRPPEKAGIDPDIVYVTSLFTYGWKAVKEAVTFYRRQHPKALFVLGGIYASLLSDHAAEEIRPDVIWKGIIPEVEDLLPDYSLIEGWTASLVFSSRGCIRRCPFCAVPILEPDFEAKPSVKHLVLPEHKSIILLDNNFLASSYSGKILNELAELRNSKKYRYKIDFNQGIDARLITSDVALALAKLNIPLIRLAYDSIVQKEAVGQAIKLLTNAGIRKRNILVYVMFNYMDTPDDFFCRIKHLFDWGVVVYPMRYQPLDALEKDSYVAPEWTPELLEMVADARRVLGVNGTWPPYEGLKRKFLNAKDLFIALELRAQKGVVV
ncbi:hypothetical protein G7K71_18460 [Desulfofundulus sp. TPOSR]|uniref:hypothetical protein n=1 Tax=Desulfofundulus sp. TPOSR TaxID=2714340 RepID=UPI00140B09C1|nr:hypothetical protein [Desulfofundulus sp. TPOSR]NHM28907.1 hypothetical protein [Desulfofundulus sp. TPOSR]